MASYLDEQGNLVDTENRVQFGNENFDSEPYQYTPNYLGANSPMLDEGNARLSSLSDYGSDPAFGYLENYYRGSTDYPGSGRRIGYFDDRTKGEVPSLQRALGNERFALAPEQPQGIAFNNPVGGLDQYAREMEALEAARGGQEVSVNELGGTLQDFYTNRNPGTNANTKFEVIDDDINFNTQPQELGFIESAPQPKEAIYQDRIMNRNLSNSNYEPRQGILQGLQDKIGAGFNNVKDFAMDKGRMGRNLLGSAGAMAMGLPGIVGSGLMSLLGGLKESPEQAAMMDLYNSENYQNVLNQIPGMANYNPVYGMGSGYGLTNAINKRLATLAKTRKRQGDKFSDTLRKREEALKKLAALEASKDFARIGASGRRPGSGSGPTTQDTAAAGGYSPGQAGAGTGGYSYDSGGRQGYGYGLKDGGIASMFTRRR